MTDYPDGIHRKRSVSLSVRADLLDEAKGLNLNASAAAETGIEEAVRAAKERQWLKSAKRGIDAHNARVADRGTLLTPAWSRDDGAL